MVRGASVTTFSRPRFLADSWITVRSAALETFVRRFWKLVGSGFFMGGCNCSAGWLSAVPGLDSEVISGFFTPRDLRPGS